MTKIPGLFTLLIVCASGVLFADELDQAGKKSSLSSESAGQLVDLNASRLTARMDEMERRLTDLSRENRYQDQQISSLERDIDDIRRRHLR